MNSKKTVPDNPKSKGNQTIKKQLSYVPIPLRNAPGVTVIDLEDESDNISHFRANSSKTQSTIMDSASVLIRN